MEHLTFKEPETLYSQQTIVKILRNRHYYFKPINEYENTQFYCMVVCSKQMNIFEKLLNFILGDKTDYVDCPLMIDVNGEYGKPVMENFVFTRDDVSRIIADVPETYVGEFML